MRVFISLLLLAAIGFLIWLIFFSPYKDQLGFQVVTGIDKKIVYSIENPTGNDILEMQMDCRERGGVFNECGSPCAPDEVCVQVCAYTCEF